MNKIDRRNYKKLIYALNYFRLDTITKYKLNKMDIEYNKSIDHVREKPIRRKAFRKKRHESRQGKKKISDHKAKYLEYLKSDEWMKIRVEMLSIYKKCARCDSKYQLQIHHKTYKNIFKEEPEDLEVLCKACHKAEHYKTG